MKDINPEFKTHMLNSAGKENAKGIAHAFNNLLGQLQVVCSNNREFSICKTKLEEACFFAKKSMAVDAKNQE